MKLGPAQARAAPSMLESSMRPSRLVLALLLLAACKSSCGTPEARVRRTVAGHAVEIEADGQVKVGMEGAGAPHAGIGIFWPTLEGFGYALRLRVDDRDEVELGALHFGDERLPRKAELRQFAEAVELAFSPDGSHLAVRSTAGERWHVLHLLAKGPPFKSRHADAFGTAPRAGESLDFAALPTSEAIGLEMLANDSSLSSGFRQALRELPVGPPWDHALLDRWRNRLYDDRTASMVAARLEPDSGVDPAWRQRALATAWEVFEKWNAGEGLRVLAATEDEAVLRRADERLPRLFPRGDVTAPLLRRLEQTAKDPSRAGLRAAARARALAELRPSSGKPNAMTYDESLRVLAMVDGNVASPDAVDAVLLHWPGYAPAHEWLVKHLGDLPPDRRARVLALSRPRLDDGGETGPRANGVAFALLRETAPCPELATYRERSGRPAECRLPPRCQ